MHMRPAFTRRVFPALETARNTTFQITGSLSRRAKKLAVSSVEEAVLADTNLPFQKESEAAREEFTGGNNGRNDTASRNSPETRRVLQKSFKPISSKPVGKMVDKDSQGTSDAFVVGPNKLTPPSTVLRKKRKRTRFRETQRPEAIKGPLTTSFTDPMRRKHQGAPLRALLGSLLARIRSDEIEASPVSISSSEGREQLCSFSSGPNGDLYIPGKSPVTRLLASLAGTEVYTNRCSSPTGYP